MSQQLPPQEEIGWVEAALILILVVTVVIVILGLLGPTIVNSTVIPAVMASVATVSNFVVKNSTMFGFCNATDRSSLIFSSLAISSASFSSNKSTYDVFSSIRLINSSVEIIDNSSSVISFCNSKNCSNLRLPIFMIRSRDTLSFGFTNIRK